MQINNSLCTADTVCIYDASTNERKPNQPKIFSNVRGVNEADNTHIRTHTQSA